MRIVDKVEQEMFKFSHAHDPYSVGMRDGMGDAADAVLDEVNRIVAELQKEAAMYDEHDPSISCGLRKAVTILTGYRKG